MIGKERRGRPMVRATEAAGCLLVRLGGGVDPDGWRQLRGSAGAALEAGRRRIVVDLSAVRWAGGALLGCLSSIRDDARAKGGALELRGTRPAVVEAMEKLGFAGFFTAAATSMGPAATGRRHGGAAERGDLPTVQVFGQPELVAHLERGGSHHTHLVSIGNPRSWFGANRPDTRMPAIFRRHFRRVLRLTFYDVEKKGHLRPRQVPRRIPRRADVRRAIRFFRATRAEATGYTLHCWQGISRSTAFALGYLFLVTGSEEEAGRRLLAIRPDAGPHQAIVRWFDEELGCDLSRVNERIRKERLARWKRELDLSADALLEELPASDDAP